MVELVDDDDVEVLRRQAAVAGGVEALDRGEHVLEVLSAGRADPQLPERRVEQALAEGRAALLQDLRPVRDEQQPRVAGSALRR